LPPVDAARRAAGRMESEGMGKKYLFLDMNHERRTEVVSQSWSMSRRKRRRIPM